MSAHYYSDDSCTIYHGDCRDVLLGLAAQSVDLLLTDPPYGINHIGGKLPGMAGDADLSVAIAGVKAALRCLRFHRHAYVFGPFDMSTVTLGATTELIWDKGKQGQANWKLPWGTSHECIAFGVWTPYKSNTGVSPGVARLRKGTVISVPKQNNGRGAQSHPTEKPVRLMRELIETSSQFDELVLDPFMGSGTTLVAAKAEGRRAIGIEIDERYCEIAAKRLAQQVLDFGTV